jgi:hypothetical protein
VSGQFPRARYEMACPRLEVYFLASGPGNLLSFFPCQD